MKRKSLIIVSDPRKVTGQSVMGEEARIALGEPSTLYLDRYSWENVMNLIIHSYSGHALKIYITLSRTKHGAFRDWIFLSVLKRAEVYGHFHGMGFNRGYFLRKNVNRCSSVIVLTQHMKSSLLNFFPELTCYIIENPTRLKWLENTQKNDTVVYYSNLMRSKGINEFVGLAMETMNTYNFEAAGRNLENIKLPNYIKYRGLIQGRERYDFLTQASYLVFFTNYVEESFPLVLIEALYTGVLPIVRRHNGIDKLFEGYGFVWVDSFDDLIEVFRKKSCLENSFNKFSELRNQKKTQIIHRFSKERFSEELMLIWENNYV